MAAAIIAAYLGARTVNIFIATALAPALELTRPAAQRQTAGAAVALDVERMAKLFDVPLPKKSSDDKASAPSRQGWSATPVRTSLRGSLAGTAVADPQTYSLCEIIDPERGEPAIYGIGETYLGARIYRIERTRVLFDHDGTNEYLDAGSAGPAPVVASAAAPASPEIKQASKDQYVIARSTLNGALNDFGHLAAQARIVPSFKDGVSDGFKLFSIVPDSLYAQIGIQNGDVIHRINGYEMNSPDKALEVYQKLRDASRIELTLERRGETLRKTYSIE